MIVIRAKYSAYSLREATRNSVVTIGLRTLKFAEYVHTSF